MAIDNRSALCIWHDKYPWAMQNVTSHLMWFGPRLRMLARRPAAGGPAPPCRRRPGRRSCRRRPSTPSRGCSPGSLLSVNISTISTWLFRLYTWVVVVAWPVVARPRPALLPHLAEGVWLAPEVQQPGGEPGVEKWAKCLLLPWQ